MLVLVNSVYENCTHGIGILNFSLRKILQNEFTKVYTYTSGGHVPAEPIWSISWVSVSIDKDIISQKRAHKGLT